MLNTVDPIGRGGLSYLEFTTVAIVVQLFVLELSQCHGPYWPKFTSN